jgi:triosephosphate isomerase
MQRALIAGNWKMNTRSDSASALASALASEFPNEAEGVEILVCPPFPYLATVRERIEGSAVHLGAQNVYFEPAGAYTGEVAVEMLTDVGCEYVIVGHSERRHVLGETDELINKKARAALEGGLRAILCVGELLAEREAGRTEEVLETQMSGGLEGLSADDLEKIVIAYEPVWAIGTGVTATPEQADSAHAHLRKWLAGRYNGEVASRMRIQYGGSVKPDNAASLLALPNVNGALVGGASLNAESFGQIIAAGIEVSRGSSA